MSYGRDFGSMSPTSGELISKMKEWNHLGFFCELQAMSLVDRKITASTWERVWAPLFRKDIFSLSFLTRIRDHLPGERDIVKCTVAAVRPVYSRSLTLGDSSLDNPEAIDK